MPENNGQLINKLLEQQKTSAYAQQLTVDPGENQLTITRVVTAKYKVYVIILLILLVLLGTKYLPEGFAHFQAIQDRHQAKELELQNLKDELKQMMKDKVQLAILQKYKPQILLCVNEKKGCERLPEDLQNSLKDGYSEVITYMQVGNLVSEKMGIDEQKILRNLDQYLIKNDPSAKRSTPNGSIEGIEIGEPELVDQDNHFYKVPIVVKVTFVDKDDLISFVDNIEKYIIPEEKDRILYQIEEVSYDMMAYDETQTTDIALTAYYFN